MFIVGFFVVINFALVIGIHTVRLVKMGIAFLVQQTVAIVNVFQMCSQDRERNTAGWTLIAIKLGHFDAYLDSEAL